MNLIQTNSYFGSGSSRKIGSNQFLSYYFFLKERPAALLLLDDGTPNAHPDTYASGAVQYTTLLLIKTTGRGC